MVDLQNDFPPGGALPVPRARGINLQATDVDDALDEMTRAGAKLL